jgi:hypothetical protein
MTSNTMISPANYSVDNIVFSEPQSSSIPDSSMTFKRINIQTRNEDGTLRDLVIGTSRLFSFGVSEERSPETDKVNGYKMPLCCWDRNGATKEEKAFTDLLEEIADKCKDHVIANKDELEKYDLQRSDLRKICSALYWKTDMGKRVEGQGPTLYAKLLHYRKDNQFGTDFFNPNTGEDISPLDLIGKRCDVVAAIKIDNIFVGRDVRIQIKILDASVEERQARKTGYVPRTYKRDLSVAASNVVVNNTNQEDDEGSLASSDEEPEPEPKTKPKTKPVKKKRKIVKRGLKR